MKKFLFTTAFVSLFLLYNVDAFSVNDVDDNHKSNRKLVGVTKSYDQINYHKIDIGGKILSYAWMSDDSKEVYDHGMKLDGILSIKSISVNPKLGIAYGANLQLEVPAIKSKNFIPSVKGYNKGAQLFIDSLYGNFSFGYQEGVESFMKVDASMIESGDNSVTWLQYTGLSDLDKTVIYHVFPGLYSESLFNESYRNMVFKDIENKSFINYLPFRISYHAPSFMGIRFGVSYSPLGYDINLFEYKNSYVINGIEVPDLSQLNGSDDVLAFIKQRRDENLPVILPSINIKGIVPSDKPEFIGGSYDNIISAGLSYDNSFNDIDFRASIVGEYASDRKNLKSSYVTYQRAEDLAAFAIGASVTYHNIILAASYGYLGKSGYISHIYEKHGQDYQVRELKNPDSYCTYYWNLGAKYIYDKASVSTYYFKSRKFDYDFYNFDIGVDYNLSPNNISKGQYKIFANYHYFDIKGNKAFKIAYSGNVMLLGMKYEF